jgi:hypothetical protein
MAQTKRRRQTKHRGNAAGVVESRGRTGRKPTAAEKSGKGQDAASSKNKRLEKYDRPPTWRGAFYRAMIAAVALLVLALLVLRQPLSQAIVYFLVALLFYTPMSYQTDRWMFNRRQRSKAKRESGGKAAQR